MKQQTQRLHFSRASVLMHATYHFIEGKNGGIWHKDLNTENVCDCPEREEDRRTLLGIELVENLTFIRHIATNEPRYEVKT